MEIWKKHKEFNYEISNFGNVRRIGKKYVDKNGVEKQKETKFLKPSLVGVEKTVKLTTQIRSKLTT